MERRASSDWVDLAAAVGLRVPTGIRARRLDVNAGAPGAARLATLADPALVVRGVVMRTVELGQRTSALLHAPGDLLADAGGEPDPFRVRARALVPSTIVVLDAATIAAATQVPALAVRLAAAADRQTDALALQTLLAQLTSIDERLQVLLPQLADRFGSVSPDGVLLPAFLSHSVLAALIGVRRPSLTTALAALDEAGTLRRSDDRRWLLEPALAGV